MRLAKYAALLLLIAFSLFSQTMTIHINYPRADFDIVSGSFVKIYHRDGVPMGNPGEPQYAAVNEHILLPPESGISSVTLKDAVWEPLAEGTPFPAQPPAILSLGNPGLIEPDTEVYSKDSWFPENPLVAYSSGNLSGYRLAAITIAPVRWNPASGIAEQLVSCDIKVEYNDIGVSFVSPAQRSPFGAQFWNRAIRDIVINPEMAARYTTEIDPDAYDWAIIIPDSPFIDLDDLLWLRRSYGLRDTVIELEDIYATYTGVDDAEKIRNAISELYAETGITYVTLLGDPLVTPTRTVFAFDCEAGFYDDENQIRSDMYFSDLDGSWNADEDTIWGEIADSVDLYPDVLVGRYSLFPGTDLNGYIDKLITYENFPSEDFAHRGLMLGQVLWDDPYTDGGEFKDDLAENVFHGDFTFGRVYSRDGGDAETGLDSLNTGPNLVNHAGHASSSVICLAHGSCIWLTEMDELENEARPSVMFSIGCWPAAFDKDCIAEHYVNNGLGGGAAFIGNSRYGWGSPGNAGYGYSEFLDRAYWRYIFNGYPALGEALALTKVDYIPYARWENVWRWVIMELNLLGDPATDAITGWNELTVEREISGENISAQIHDTSGPIANATVSIYDDSGLVDRTKSNSSGYATFDLSEATAPVYFAVRQRSLGVQIDTITTIGAGFFHYYYTDEYGYSDLSADPADTVRVNFTFGDFDTDLTAISWDPSSNFGSAISTSPIPSTLPAGDSTAIWAEFFIPENVSPDTNLIIQSSITSSAGDIGYEVSLPLNVADYEILGSVLYDDDSTFETGEIASVWMGLLNYGDGSDGADNLELTCPGGELNITGSPAMIPNFEPQDTTLVGPFDIQWAPGEDAIPVVELMGTIEDEIHSLYLSTRQLGFTTDVESGAGPFFTDSGENHWRRVNTRSCSGDWSWWCGDPIYGTYLPGLNDALYSEQFVIGADAELSFNAYMSFPNYGSDGLSVEILGSEDTVRVDYLGSGGALLSFIVGWSEYRYQFDDTPFEPGDTIRIRFRFSSDSDDEEEGVFIDDIQLCCNSTEFSIGMEESPSKPESASLNVYPNPFNASLRIDVSGAISDDARLAIFDINGRIVKELSISNTSDILWEGRAENGEQAASGVYFVRMIDGNKVFTARAVLLK